jgi:hypothetical protein
MNSLKKLCRFIFFLGLWQGLSGMTVELTGQDKGLIKKARYMARKSVSNYFSKADSKRAKEIDVMCIIEKRFSVPSVTKMLHIFRAYPKIK